MFLKNTNLYAVVMAVVFTIFLASCGSQGSSGENAESTEEDTTEVKEETTKEETSEEDAPIASPRKKAEGEIGGVSVVVDYGSPGVKDRKIWGGLEEYGVVWRAGANETTAVKFSEDVKIGSKKVAAGKYGLYMIPNENADWEVIFNKDWDREEHGAWGAYNYNAENDVARVKVTPEWVEENQERLVYTVEEGGIGFAWEKAKFTIPVSKAE